MNEQHRISDELLNAFIDDELDTADWTEIVKQLRVDNELAGRVCELRQHKDMVQKAYRLPKRSSARVSQSRYWWRNTFNAVAISVLLLAGVAVGWVLGNGNSFHFGSHFSQLAQVDPALQDNGKILIHIATADPKRLKTALDETEELLSGYQAKGKKVQIEIVANSEGVELLQSNSSPYVDRIIELMARYDNLTILACSRSLEKMRLKGLEVHLIPDVGIVPGALEEIVTRLQEGWVYIKV